MSAAVPTLWEATDRLGSTARLVRDTESGALALTYSDSRSWRLTGALLDDDAAVALIAALADAVKSNARAGTPGGSEPLTVYVIVELDDRPMRYTDGSMWQTTSYVEACGKRDELNLRREPFAHWRTAPIR